MRGDALQTSKNIGSTNRELLVEIVIVFQRKNVKPQSMATTKHYFQQIVSNPANHKFIGFLVELQKLAREAFKVAAQATINKFMNAKKPPHPKKSINQADLGNRPCADCLAPWKLVRAERFRSFRWISEKYCDATCHKTKPWRIKADMSPLEKTNPIPKSMRPTHKRERPRSRQQNTCWK